MKEQNIVHEEWDYLLVLDACRYDSFKEVCPDYLKEGELEKRNSPASATAGWLEKSFPGKYDYVYISGNPFVNSKGLPLSELTEGFTSDWKAVDRFKEIVDSWELDWDEETGTVPPEDLTKRTIKNLGKGRTIVHYMQPHMPYLVGDVEIYNEGLERARSKFEEKTYLDKINIKAKDMFYPIWKRLDMRSRYRLKKVFGMNTDMEEFIMKGGKKEILNYYRDNLGLVLEWIEKLLPSLDGRVVITADHGEAFGERGVWWHEYNLNIPVLNEVPWFVVDMEEYEGRGELVIEDIAEKNEKEEIKEKLEKLGYM